MIGHTYQLTEPDYRFGTGTILVTVSTVVGQTEYDREPWWMVHGRVAVGTTENHGGWQNRDFLEVRGNSLHLARVMVTDTA